MLVCSLARANHRSIIALLFAVGLAAPAQAQDLCVGLRQALAQAGQDFAGLKTSTVSADRELRRYPAQRLVPGASECNVTENRLAYRYRCNTTSERASPAQARAAYARDVARVQQCFPNVSAARHGDPANLVTGTAWTEFEINRQISVRVQIALLGEQGFTGPMNYSAIIVEKSQLRRP